MLLIHILASGRKGLLAIELPIQFIFMITDFIILFIVSQWNPKHSFNLID